MACACHPLPTRAIARADVRLLCVACVSAVPRARCCRVQTIKGPEQRNDRKRGNGLSSESDRESGRRKEDKHHLDYIRHNQNFRHLNGTGRRGIGEGTVGGTRAVNKPQRWLETVHVSGTFGRYLDAIGGFFRGISQDFVRKNRIFRAGRGVQCKVFPNFYAGRASAGRISSMPYIPAGM
jgi:hypothetical protein